MKCPCKHMRLFESMLPEAIPLTDEQFQIFLEKTAVAEHSRHILSKYIVPQTLLIHIATQARYFP
mgnify:CR=1 FL=1|jgi:hypothetical protein